MQRTTYWTRAQWIAVAVAAVLASACGLDKQTQPSLIGPGNGGTSVFLAATPDRLPRDGQSQSVVRVEVRGPDGRAIPGSRVTLGIQGGTLSQTDVVTGTDGRATFTVQAPSQSDVVPGNIISVFATPVTTDFNNATTQSLAIALTGVTNSTAPLPAFTVTPAAPEVNTVATFDATTTTDEGQQCLTLCTYQWNFDDGGTAFGSVATHTFTVARAFNVALTVTDASGVVATLRKVVTPIAPAEPTVTLTVSPNPPVVNQPATFNANGVAAPNHQIIRYEWNFGDSGTTSTAGGNVAHTYSTRGIYTVTVRAIDDLGNAGSASMQLNLSTGISTGVNASFFFSPTNPAANTDVFFDAKASTPSNGATITNYRWDFGDGNGEDAGTTPTTKHQFGLPQTTYVVKLTVTDSQGRTGSTTLNVVTK